MLTEVVLTHPCDTTVHLLAGAWTTPRGRPITHCHGCGEWLGSPFLRVDAAKPTPARCRRGGLA
ncbi:MAG: hypothetical protein M3P53_04930 [Actinomycetota bacterium]|nr:hypothetical protein [Actinomycetota bacterium]